MDSICFGSILPVARSTGLITVREYEDCRAERTESRQAEQLMECVERAVVADPANFNLFLCVLDQCEQKNIAEYLRLLNRSMILPKPAGRVKFYMCIVTEICRSYLIFSRCKSALTS